MNNKGQSLVTFVLILPILLLIVLMVYEIGMMSRLKNEMNSINYLAISYGIDKITDENLEEEIKALILKNDDKIENIVVSVEDNKLYITLSSRYNARLSLLRDSKMFRVRSSYVGYIEDGKQIIKEASR